MPLFRLLGRDEAAFVAPSGPAVGGAAVQPDGLSPREVEVLRLIAAGKTNQEIGYRLFISLNTVATHVRRIYEKTQSANRAEAACYALRRHLA